MGNIGEPSVEEILESIKKVIARDDSAGAEDEHSQRESLGIADVSAAEQEDILDLGETAELANAGAVTARAEGSAALVADDTRSSVSDSLAALALLAEPSAPPQIVRSGETSLESMARELLRPALTEWLEKNLPTLVESMVAAEIARIVGKKG